MTEAEYGTELDRIASEIKQANQLFRMYIEMHNYANDSRAVYDLFNRDAPFWNTTLYALQQTWFVVLGRIFDNARGAHSINKVVVQSIKHPEFFSKQALRARRKTDPQPAWLDDFIADAHEPTKSDLTALDKSLAKHRRTYDDVYRAIRSDVVAHTIVKDRAEVEALFSKALVGKVDAMHAALLDVESWTRCVACG
jgi:hypothetical protein